MNLLANLYDPHPPGMNIRRRKVQSCQFSTSSTIVLATMVIDNRFCWLNNIGLPGSNKSSCVRMQDTTVDMLNILTVLYKLFMPNWIN